VKKKAFLWKILLLLVLSGVTAPATPYENVAAAYQEVASNDTAKPNDEPREAPVASDALRYDESSVDNSPLFTKDEKISIFVSVSCENDMALEAAMRVVAHDRLRTVKNIKIAGSIDEASVLLSFAGFRSQPVSGDSRGQIIYSFAYGVPDLELVDNDAVSLPRYIYHEAILTNANGLASSIDENIQKANDNFIKRLR
jgi:hypothetical protein